MRSALIWQSPLACIDKLLVEVEALRLMEQHCQVQATLSEAGGILLGFRRGDHLQVVTATTPQLADRRHSYSFHRRDREHQRIATRYWKDSGETMDYLGEWHTHPTISPSPSVVDRTEWQVICGAQNRPMIFIILGVSGRIWAGLGSAVSDVREAELLVVS